MKQSHARLSGLRVMLLLDMSIGDGDRLLARFRRFLLTWRLHLPIWLLLPLLWLLRPSLRLGAFYVAVAAVYGCCGRFNCGGFCLPFSCCRHHHLMVLTLELALALVLLVAISPIGFARISDVRR